MRRLITRVTILLAGVLLTGVAWAGDVEDVKAEYIKHITRSRTGEIDAFVDQHMVGHTAFGPGSGLLTRFDDPEAEKRSRGGRFSGSGGEPIFVNVAGTLRHLEVQVYGGNAAVVTCYLNGAISMPDGTSRPGTRRVTAVWIKQGDQWKEVHDHMSPLLISLSAERER
ncbi:MAG: nuclear transport factor 2 family protein [Acidobacteria bacterium]|nr:nuclear transport factor 2 family protein [Acidobacteriota bacterium]